MKCLHCGSEIPNDSRFCGMCGQPVVDVAPRQNVEPQQSVPSYAHAPQPAPDYMPASRQMPQPTPDYMPAPQQMPQSAPDYMPTPQPAPQTFYAPPASRARRVPPALIAAIVALVVFSMACFGLAAWNQWGPGSVTQQTQGGYNGQTDQPQAETNGGVAQDQNSSSAAEEAAKAEEAKKAEEAAKAEEAKKAEEARKAEEAAKAEEARKAEEAKKAEEAARANAYIDAYEAVLDAAPADASWYTLVEMSGDDIPELIVVQDPGAGAHKPTTYYWYDAEAQTLKTVGTDLMHPFRDHLMEPSSGHTLINAGYYGGMVMYREFAVEGALVQQIGDGSTSEGTDPGEMGWTSVQEYGIDDRSPLEALRR